MATGSKANSRTVALANDMDLVKRVLGIHGRDPQSLEANTNVLGSLESLTAGASRMEGLIMALGDSIRRMESSQDVSRRVTSTQEGPSGAIPEQDPVRQEEVLRQERLERENLELKALLHKHLGAPGKGEIRNPTPYLGDRDSELLENFLYDMEEWFEAKATPEDRKFTVAKTYIDGHAKKWLRTKLDHDRANGLPVMSTWGELKEALKAQFFPQDTDWRARNRLMALTQTGSIRDYIAEFNSIMSDLPDMHEKCRVYHFQRGLKLWVQNELRRKSVTTVQQAILAAEGLNDFRVESPASKVNVPSQKDGPAKPGRKRKRKNFGKKSSEEVGNSYTRGLYSLCFLSSYSSCI